MRSERKEKVLSKEAGSHLIAQQRPTTGARGSAKTTAAAAQVKSERKRDRSHSSAAAAEREQARAAS